jgi:hypothetical protein
MSQITLDFPLVTTEPAEHGADPVSRTGFDIGWDHAHHGLVPPPELLLVGTPVQQGWMAGKAVFSNRTLSNTRHTRQWLQLRLLAWRRGVAFEGLQLTPNYLAQIQAKTCPVTRTALQGNNLSIERLNPQAGYAAGNVAVLSTEAAQAWQGASVHDAVRLARAAEADPTACAIPAAQWWRLATLRAFATPLPFTQAATLPLAVLPPNRVRVLNAAQGLQVLVTLMFATPGWSARCRNLAQGLPEHSLRQDFNLFVGAMAPRVLEAGSDPVVLRHALEDAWLQERVQRRWQHFVLSLGEVACEALLQRITGTNLATKRTVQLTTEQATDGWALAQGGRAAITHEVLVRPKLGPRLPQRLATADNPPKNKSATTVASV